ncbi:hypothetical protein VTJ83DRAFT_6094 [Remersonia thermophila]|uniref:Uncharacterized protein n=1 Tax=Remersonia thermophila TaxID=72144 RepID=A0ABR4D900_9PEZI
MGKGPLTIHGGRRLVPREHVAVAAIILFSITLVASAASLTRHLLHHRFHAVPTSLCMLALALLRMTVACTELDRDPFHRPRTVDLAIALLDAMSLVLVMGMLVSHFLSHFAFHAGRPPTSGVAYRVDETDNDPVYAVEGEEPKDPREPVWQRFKRLAAVAVAMVLAVPVYVAGAVVALGLEAQARRPELLQAGVMLFAAVGLLVVWCLVRPPDERGRVSPRLVVLYVAVTAVRLIWSLTSPWFLWDQRATFNPFRDNRASTLMHMGMVLVTEFLLSLLCCWYPGIQGRLKEHGQMRQ